MARQPTIGGDSGSWGSVLNSYLSVSLDANGALIGRPINVKAPPYNAVGNGVADDTAAIQAALDAAKSDNATGVVWFPPGTYLVSQLRFYKGQTLRGAGMGLTPHRGSTIVQKDGVNESCIIPDPTAIITTDYAHWVRIEHLHIQKVSGATDTVGSGIDINCRTGEGFSIAHVYVELFPENGIRFQHGGAPCFLQDLHTFSNGTHGLSIERGAGDTWQTFGVTGLSGDNNGTALGRILLAGDSRESFAFRDVKAETSAASKQANVFVFDNTNGVPIVLENLGILADQGQTGTAVVRIVNSNAKLAILGNTGNGFTHLIQDVVNSKTYDTFGEMLVLWRAGVPYKFPLSGAVAWTPPGIASASQATTTLSINGAQIGDRVTAGFTQALPATAQLWGSVTAAGTVTAVIRNYAGGTLTLSAGTVTADVWQH